MPAKTRDKNQIKIEMEHAARHFSAATEIDCFCAGKEDGIFFDTGLCRFCECLGDHPDADCRGKLLQNAALCERFDGRYIFYCPMGLVHFSSPVYVGGRLFAVMVGGPVLMSDPEDYLADEVWEKRGLGPEHEPLLRARLRNVKRVAPERVTSLSHLLFALCSFIGGSEQLLYIHDEESIGNEMEKYLTFIQTMGAKPEPGSYPIEKERELLSLIAMGDKIHSRRLLDDILAHILSYSNKEFEKAKARILELVVLLSRAALEGGADLEEIFGLNYKFLGQINGYKTVEELSNWLFNIMIRFTDSVFRVSDAKHAEVIVKATEYIKKNYARKITLEDVAGHVYLSPSYFSKIFKQEMSVSFNAYLNRIRIENGKRLLLRDDADLLKISEAVGFEDQSYFSKVFKKITGVTPGVYRRRHGKTSVPPPPNPR